MEHEYQIKEQIARCRRLAHELTDEEMRRSLEALARDYEAKLKRHPRSKDEGFMLRRDGGDAAAASRLEADRSNRADTHMQ